MSSPVSPLSNLFSTSHFIVFELITSSCLSSSFQLPHITPIWNIWSFDFSFLSLFPTSPSFPLLILFSSSSIIEQQPPCFPSTWIVLKSRQSRIHLHHIGQFSHFSVMFIFFILINWQSSLLVFLMVLKVSLLCFFCSFFGVSFLQPFFVWNLCNNNLTSLPSGVFNGLNSLKNLHTLPSFHTHTYLSILFSCYLCSNKLTSIHPDVFNDLTHLEYFLFHFILISKSYHNGSSIEFIEITQSNNFHKSQESWSTSFFQSSPLYSSFSFPPLFHNPHFQSTHFPPSRDLW